MLARFAIVMAVIGGVIVGVAAIAPAHAVQPAYTPTSPSCSASQSSANVGQAVTVSCEFDAALSGREAAFTASGPGVRSGALASVATAVTGSTSVVKTIVGTSASARFTVPAEGTFTIRITTADGSGISTLIQELQLVGLAVTSSGGSSGNLPQTGSVLPSYLVWTAVGGIVLGVGAMTAASWRRRRQAPTSIEVPADIVAVLHR